VHINRLIIDARSHMRNSKLTQCTPVLANTGADVEHAPCTRTNLLLVSVNLSASIGVEFKTAAVKVCGRGVRTRCAHRKSK
jgi:hypothetical protein